MFDQTKGHSSSCPLHSTYKILIVRNTVLCLALLLD
jgi:hypothetical protein